MLYYDTRTTHFIACAHLCTVLLRNIGEHFRVRSKPLPLDHYYSSRLVVVKVGIGHINIVAQRITVPEANISEAPKQVYISESFQRIIPTK